MRGMLQRPTPNERGEDRPDVRESIAAPWTLDVGRWTLGVEKNTFERGEDRPDIREATSACWALGVEKTAIRKGGTPR